MLRDPRPPGRRDARRPQPKVHIAGLAGLLSLATLAAQQPAPDTVPPAVREQTRDGTFTSWYANGRVREQGSVDADGKRYGEWILRHPNGRMAAFGSYRDGQRHEAWSLCDQYGRVVRYQQGKAGETTAANRCTILPLCVDDLRLTLLGERTLGDILDAYQLAPGAAAARRLTSELAPLGAIPAVVAFDEAERASTPQKRIGWLELLAMLELPEDKPTESLERWQWDPECGAAARAVLEHWSARFRAEWEPLCAEGNADPKRYRDLCDMGTKAYGALWSLRRRLPERDLGAAAALSCILRAPPSARPQLERDLDSDDRVARMQSLVVPCPGLPPVATLMRLVQDADSAVAFWAARRLVADHQVRPDRYDAHLDAFSRHPMPELRACAARRLVQLGRDQQALPHMRARLRAVFDDGEATTRSAAFTALSSIAEGEERLPLLEQGLDDREPAVRAQAVALLRDPSLPGLSWARMLALVRDPATRQAAVEVLPLHPLPEGFDPRQLDCIASQLSPEVLATWAEGHSDRVAVLVDQALTRGSPWQAQAALELLPAALLPFAARVREAARNQPATAAASQLFEMLLPGEARSIRVRTTLEAMAGPSRSQAGIRGWSSHPILPAPSRIDPADDVPMVVAALSDPDPAIAVAAVQLLERYGKAGAGAAEALIAAIPTLPATTLCHLPRTLLSIAPDRLTSVCRLLFDHRDEGVQAAAMQPGSWKAATVPVDPAFTRRLVAVIAGIPPDPFPRGVIWFELLADHGRSALPDLIAALAAQPLNRSLAAALAVIGPDAIGARAELLAALAAGNGQAALALGRALPHDAQVREQLIAALASGGEEVASAAAATLARLPCDDAADTTVLRAMVETGSPHQALWAATTLARLGGTDVDTLEGLLAFRPRPWTNNSYEVEARMPLAQTLALLPRCPAREREYRLKQALVRAWPQRDTPQVAELVATALRGLDQARDRPAMLRTLADLTPRHPLIMARYRDRERSWNRGCETSLPFDPAPELLVQRWLEGRMYLSGKDYAGLLAPLRKDPAAAIAAIRPHLDSTDRTHRSSALTILACLGEAGRSVFAEAAAALDEPLACRDLPAVALAIAATSSDEASAAQTLLDMAGGQPPSSMWWLGKLPPGVVRAMLARAPADTGVTPWMPGLLPASERDDAQIEWLRAELRKASTHDRPHLIAAARGCGARAVELLPELRAWLQRPVIEWRLATIDLLGELGPAAAAAMPELAAQEPIPACRFTARRALARIRSDAPLVAPKDARR